MAELAVQTSGLSKSFGKIRAVTGLDLAVPRGEMFSLVGPDGAGKTTTIRMLCGLLPPTSGKARVLGYDLVGQSDKIKRSIGYLPQKFSLYGDLTIEENIEFFAEIHRVDRFGPRRDELLDFTRLTPFRKRLADRLSGGMRQKLALVCTLIHTPRLLFLDEPTTGVDPVSRRDFWKILSDLLKTGITILMTTPYLDEAERCSRVGLMNGGRLMTAAPPAEVKALMRGTVVEIVCGDTFGARAALRGLPAAREVQIFGDRLDIVVDDMEKDLPAVEARLSQAGIVVLDRRAVPPSLENVFISVTRPAAKEASS
jgi:ABC-2 type transport system ATP-binding protein